MLKVSVNGSAMIMGEHTVLHNGSAMVAALDVGLDAVLLPRSDNIIQVRSTLGTWETNLDALKDLCVFPDAFQYIATACQYYCDRLQNGFELSIQSVASSKQGLGTSAAVTAASIAILEQFVTGCQPTPTDLFSVGRDVILACQSSGSGADLAASIYGGMLKYHMGNPVPLCRTLFLPFHLVYCGYKTKTPDVIAAVNAMHIKSKKKVDKVYACMREVVDLAWQAYLDQDLVRFGLLANQYYDLQCDLNLSTDELDNIIQVARQDPNVVGAKISGSGLGDCAIIFGEPDLDTLATVGTVLSAQMSLDGLSWYE